MQFFLDATLYSYAQIFFSNRKWFGAVILLATFTMPLLGLIALFGVILSNLTASVLKFDSNKIRTGFYGFNGILFGAASAYYFQLNIELLFLIPVFIIITFFISAVLEHLLEQVFNLPGLSLPFILSIYIFIIFLTNYNYIETNLYLSSVGNPDTFISASIFYYLKSMALIVFQPNYLAGIIISIAVLFFSRVLFVLSIVAFALNSIFLNLILPDQYNQLIILAGFNSILTSFAVGGSLILTSRKSFLLVIISTLMVVIFTGVFAKIFSGTLYPILVLPFNFIVLSTIYSLKFRKEQTDLVLLYFKPGSPEENYYYHQKRKVRFENFKFIFPELPFYGEWQVSQAFDGEFTHKGDWKYAWDFVVVDEKNSQFANNGDLPEDYYCYNLPVAAPLDGEIVKVIDGVPENEIGNVNLQKNWGNTIIIKHEYDLYSSISHLKYDSIKVKDGQRVKKGEIIAACGNSGRSPYPHIHFQFQVNDKVGEKTHKFPLSNFIEKKGEDIHLRTFSFPKKDTIVQNIEMHRTIKDAFNFKLSDTLEFKYIVDGEEKEESWELKVDMANQLYFESSNHARADVYITDKVFYFISYSGEKNTALYYFYLLAMQVPFCFNNKLTWEDHYSVSLLPLGYLRYLSEFFLFYKSMLDAKGSFSFEEDEESKNFIVRSKINVEGMNLFAFFNREYNGAITIDEKIGIKEFEFINSDRKTFKVQRIINEGD
ncbi:MAG TPA: urea transporter [Ignavibacteriaceae bacterium]|nr:urea transporter [Ignavibacteriaceae bacterium]HRP92250.1 urea transporter [Ignavibacteriaceae bacterium]HRQ54995.1 urea transporter [Ignavibacteriaceae bacterium]